MRYVLMVLTVFIFMAMTCKKENADPELKRDQTQCADPWGYGGSEQETLNRLREYLLKKNIELTSLSMKKVSPAATCLACTCTNGNTFYITADEKYRDALKLEGFE
jgi:hypothetical protein